MTQRNNQSDIIDIKALLNTYISKWYYFAISVVIFGCIGLVYSVMKKPNYQVCANVVISQDKGGALGALSGIADVFGGSAAVDDEIFIVSSHTVYRDVARDLNLNIKHETVSHLISKSFKYKDFPVQVYPAPGIVDTLTATVLFRVKVNDEGLADVTVKAKKKKIARVKDATFPITIDCIYGTYTIDTTKYFEKGKSLKTYISVTGYGSAAEDMAEDITSEIASKRSNVIQLGIRTTNPEYGEDVLNEIITKYNERGVNVKNMQGQKTAEFLAERLNVISDELDVAESNLQNYKEQHGIVDLKADAEYNYRLRGENEVGLIQAQTNAEILKITKDFLSNPKNKYELLPALDLQSAGIGEAIKNYNELLLKRLEIQNNATGNNMQLRLITEQIDAMRSSITTTVDKAYENALVAVKELRAQLDKASSKLGNIPAQEKDYLTLSRQQVIKHQLYLFLLRSQEENALMMTNAVPKAEIIDEAYTLKKPLGLSRKGILAIFFLLGLMFPVALIYVIQMLRDKFETREEVEKYTNAPILGEICIDKSGEKLVVLNQKGSSISELFRLVRTNLQFVLNNSSDKVVLFTSTTSGEGKSFISINLACSLSLLNKKVLLVGMDIRKPRIGEYLKLNTSQPGLTQYLSDGSVRLNDIIVEEPFMPNLDVIMAGPIPPNPAELLQLNKVDKLFEQLRSMYDYIVVDSAPIGMVSDTFTLSRIADATVYVCRANYTPLRDIRYFNSLYEDGRLKKLSLVVNGTRTKKGYGYGYK